MTSKVLEGDKYMEEGEKHLKTSLFKWKPDYDSASSCFQNAAVCYKNAKAFEKALSAFLQLADAHYKNTSRFHAAKAYEEAGKVCKDMKQYPQAMANFDHASELYLEDGTPDTAILCLEKAGKLVENVYPDWSISSYLKAAEICEREDESHIHSAADLVGKAARLQVNLKKLDEAVKTITHELELLSQLRGNDHGASGRLSCALVLVHLHIGDQVRAEQCIYDACENISGFDGSDESEVLHSLLAAYDGRDQDEASRILRLPVFKHMDIAYAKLARSLRVPGFSPVQHQSFSTVQGTTGGELPYQSSKPVHGTSAATDMHHAPGGATVSFDEDIDLC